MDKTPIEDTQDPDNLSFLGEEEASSESKPKIMFKKFQSKEKIPPLQIILGVVVAGIISLTLVYLFGFGGHRNFFKPFSDSDELVKGKMLLENPITGVIYSREEAGPINERPLSVMMNNHIDARPQAGLADADIVYEIVAEGGITRYIPFFLSRTPEKIGPIRSARDYYLVLVKELGDAMIMHIGWSPQALEAIETWPVRSLNRGGADFWRESKPGVASEHTAYVNGVYLRERGDELGWQGRRDFRTWLFKEDSPVTGDQVDQISIDFWYQGDYSAIFKYDSAQNDYLRFTGYSSNGDPIPTIDEVSGEQVRVKTVIVQLAYESPIANDDANRLAYELIGSGDGLVFMDGTVQEVTWVKEDRDSRTLFYTLEGEEVEFNRGKIWVSVVPSRNGSQVKY